MKSDQNLVWVDMEMTGLNPDTDAIIEIATIVTDTDLKVLAEGPAIAIHQPNERLETMDEWNTNQHNASGLVERVRQSQETELTAARRTIRFIRKYVPYGKSPMCGNSICQDRRFMARYMPELEAWFHYRNLDVSTVKILMQRWRPELEASIEKESVHLALEDIRQSIEELRYYRDHFFDP